MNCPSMSTEVIFTTIHGSHLYNLAGPHSDVDTYTVTTSANRAVQRASRNPDGSVSDTVTIGWDMFLSHAFSGSHQAVEALFSPFKVWHSHKYLEPMLDDMRVAGRDVLTKYERTVTKFAHADDFKRRRHACRLWLNLQSLRWDGRFDPRMTPDEIAWATELATADVDRDQLALLLREGRSALGSFLHLNDQTTASAEKTGDTQ